LVEQSVQRHVGHENQRGSAGQPIRKAGYAPTPPNSRPKGYLDSAACTAVTGWSQDPDTPKTSIKVHVYFDGKAGGRTSPGAASRLMCAGFA